jgi:hypothetical protein
MARISITNGHTAVAVDALTRGQVLQACEVAMTRDNDPVYDEVDGQTHGSHAAWLSAYCDAHERIHGQVFVAW